MLDRREFVGVLDRRSELFRECSLCLRTRSEKERGVRKTCKKVRERESVP